MYNSYNPYLQQNAQYYPNNVQNYSQMQQNAQQLMQKPTIQGKVIDNIEVVKSLDIPLDGSISYYPTADGSAIVTKRLTQNGTSEIIVFKPFKEEIKEKPTITLEDLKNSLDAIKMPNNEEIISAIEDLRKELKKKSDK